MPRAVALMPALLALTFAPAAVAQTPVLEPSISVDGPSAGIGSLSGMSVARDGSGALVYGKAVGGIQHVFVSSLSSGAFAAPAQVDGAFGSDSSQPVIAAGDNGLLLIAFVNAGVLYVVTRPSTSAPFGAPRPIAAGASDPAIALSIHAKAYLAFTVAGNGGHDVRVAYYHLGRWALAPSPLDAVPADDAGVASGRPQVAVAGDGVAIVVWGEGGHVYSRRIWGASPSVVFEQVDVPAFAGDNEVYADLPTVATGDDSSFADVAFHEQVANGSGLQSRVLMSRLRGSQYDRTVAADELSPVTPDNAIQPRVAETGADHGFITSAWGTSNQLYGAVLGDGGLINSTTQIDSLPNASPPYAVPATTGFFSGLIAWQRDPGVGPAEIRARYYDGTSFGPEMIASSPTLGPTNAAGGLAAHGDGVGDVAIAWVQGNAQLASIVTALLYSPPGGFGLQPGSRYRTTATPVLAWSPAREQFGPLRYFLSIDGVVVAQTPATSLRVPRPLSEGPHIVQVTAVNQAQVATAARVASVFVDTLAPYVQLTLASRGRVGSRVHLSVRYTDVPPPLAPGAGSGVSSVLVNWGDDTTSRIRDRVTHAYRQPGDYRLTVVVSDRAGHRTTLGRRLRIVAAR